PIEEWLDANVGMSPCCSMCGDSDCRTLEVGGRSYETIPEEQFIKAGLMAASQMMTLGSFGDKAATSCCGMSEETALCEPTLEQARVGCCSPTRSHPQPAIHGSPPGSDWNSPD
ncbi:MAG: DUF2703 domain-containing protein, partial [Anaerolineae bacterium]|nr:DUF2703 domain-containing protein [Thermoflexales bacterium]MDW8408751.1 DUF2703 domain-containing protein [Anaerolineae bacterium]